MNKKILNVILGICFLVMLLFYIGAEENLSNSNNSLNENTINEIINEFPSLNTSFEENLINLTEEIINKSYEENNTNHTNISLVNESNLSEEIDNSFETDVNSSSIEILNAPSSGGSKSNEIEYTNLDEFIQEEAANNFNSNTEEKKDVCLLHDSLGKKVIEIENCNESDILGIGVVELEKDGFEKEVIISSQEHFDKSLRFYTSLTTEAKEEEIRIYWKNEGNSDVTKDESFFVEYYDENANGLIDKISWVVPHLSEQIFDIKIEVEKSNESIDKINLVISNSPSGEVSNPINFNISVNYSEETTCSLKINETNIPFSGNYSIAPLNLENGQYDWIVECFDSLNSEINESQNGSFSINEAFSVTLNGGDIYFLNLIENKIKFPGIASIQSENPSNMKIEIKRNGIIQYTNEINNTTQFNLPLNESILNQAGIYNLTVYFDKPSAKNSASVIFSVASANLTFNVTNIKEGQSVKITASVSSPGKKIMYRIIEYGDGDSSSNIYPLVDTYAINQDFVKKYNVKGQYNIKLVPILDGTTLNFTIQKNGITVTEVESGIDNDEPTITLFEPEHNSTIYDPIINFSYKANDNIKIQNCTFKLYGNCTSMSSCSTSDSNLIFPINSQQRTIANNYSVQNNKEVEIKLQDFNDGTYLWEVECYDNSSNSNNDWNIFKIQTNGNSSVSLQEYDQRDEVEALKEQADIFLTTSFSLEEREVLEDLNLLNDTKYYKKRLLDIEDFFQENYKYVSSEALRKSKTDEYLAELENIKNRIPQDITINENYEYIKNSVNQDFESIVRDYFDSTNTQIGRSSIQKLANLNKELQNEISVSAKIRNIEIDYANGTQEITLVKKKITLNNDSYNQLLEIVPKDVVESSKDIFFITKNKIINDDPMFEIKYEDLEKEEIVYYITSQVKIKDLEKTETVLFEEDLTKFESRFTGFLVFDSFSTDITLYAILAFVMLMVLLFIIPMVFKKFKLLGWKREPNVVKVINLIEDIKRLLREKEIEKAREVYYKLKEIYPVLPYKTKSYFYDKINEMLIKIDKKDIFGLVKEYQEAKKRWNKEDFMRLYEDIKKIYKRLPEKDRKKVHDIINGY